MTMPDLGPERPGQASETRQMVERGRTQAGGDINNRAFVLALVVVVLGLGLLVILLR